MKGCKLKRVFFFILVPALGASKQDEKAHFNSQS